MSKSRKEKTGGGYEATSKFIMGSPYKIRPVAQLLRRKPYTEAMAILENMPHKGARLLKKTLKSAGSNALNLNKSLSEDMLYVREILVDDGPRMKRIWCRARGRADFLLKRMSHIKVVVDEVSK
jgi:large subunit ribosomal protein L22